MRRASLVVAVLGFLLSNVCLADEPVFCKPACDNERRECKARVQELAGEDGKGLLHMEEGNRLARATAKLQGPSEAARAGQYSGVQTRRMQRTAACEDSYARCTRTCVSPVAGSPDSPVLINRRKAG
jgi:hypothetical protein